MTLDAVEKYKLHAKKMGAIKVAGGFFLYYVLGSIIALSRQLWNMLTSTNPFDEFTSKEAKGRGNERSVCWKSLASVDDAKSVAKAISKSTKLNDLFVALLGKALERQYQELKANAGQPTSRCQNYINIAVTAHLTGAILPGQDIGNKIGAFVTPIPFDVSPARSSSHLRKTRKISKILNSCKRTPAPLISWFITSLISKLGIESIAKDAIVRANCHAVAVVSNVHGYPFEINWKRMPVKCLCAFLPLPPKVPIGVLVTSYDGRIILSVESADMRVCPNAERFLDFMLEEYQAIKNEIRAQSE